MVFIHKMNPEILNKATKAALINIFNHNIFKHTFLLIIPYLAIVFYPKNMFVRMLDGRLSGSSIALWWMLLSVTEVYELQVL